MHEVWMSFMLISPRSFSVKTAISRENEGKTILVRKDIHIQIYEEEMNQNEERLPDLT
jgi:hypothetical protein